MAGQTNALQFCAITERDLVELVNFYNAHGRDLLGEKKMQPINPRTPYGRLVLNRDATCWIVVRDLSAENSGIVAAGVIGYHAEYEMTGRIGMMLIAEAARGQGLGGQVLDHLIADARASGCRCIKLTSKPERAAARALYASRGFRLDEGSDRHFTLRLAGVCGHVN